MLDADVRKDRGKPHADKMGQGEGVGKQVFFGLSLWTTPYIKLSPQ